MPDAAAPPPPDPDTAIAVRGLTKRYGTTTAVAELDLEVRVGQTLALLGPNGAGKTTTVECCTGYRVPDAGSVRVLGLDPRRDRTRLTPRVGVMLQEGGVYPHAYPDEVLRLFAAFHRNPLDPGHLLERVGLTASRRTRFRDLSGGQQQRLCLALALVGRPEVVYLDEPTTGLDVAARRSTWELITELQDDGVTIVLTTHLLDEAEALADRVAIIDHGRLIAAGTLAELTADEHPTVTFSSRPGLDTAALAGSLGVGVTEEDSGRYRLDADNAPELLVALTTWLAARGERIEQLRAGRSSLEEVFLELTEGTEAARDTRRADGGAGLLARSSDAGTAA